MHPPLLSDADRLDSSPRKYCQDKSADEAGGLGALTTLARAVEQESRREELSLQLGDETRTLDMLAAEVSGRSDSSDLPSCV